MENFLTFARFFIPKCFFVVVQGKKILKLFCNKPRCRFVLPFLRKEEKWMHKTALWMTKNKTKTGILVFLLLLESKRKTFWVAIHFEEKKLRRV